MYFTLSLLLWITACTHSPESGSGSTTAGAADSLDIKEWEVPFVQSRPRDPYVGPDGRVWFVGQRTHYVASFDPATGDFKKYDLEPGTGPHTVIVGDDGIVWIAGNQKAYIGRMDPATGRIEKIPMPDPKATDPHTMAFDSHGDIWFTLQVSNRIGKLNVATREVRLAEVPTASARPYGLVVDAADRPWSALLGTNKLATVDPATMNVKEIELPRQGAHPRRLGITSDGGVWYVDYEGGFLGRYDPSSGNFQEWQMPGGERSRPYGMAIDDEDRIWFVETGLQPNRFVGFDPESAEFFSVSSIPSGGGTVRHMYFDSRTGSVWFGTDTNNLGRATVRPASMP
jgi:virginiamycin B lyase